MPEIEPVVELHEQFSPPGAKARPWAEVLGVLTESEMFWLSTVRRDGRPHVAPLPAIWLDGTLHFCTGTDEQKMKNLERNPQCILTTGTNQYRSGLDVVVEGAAVQVTGQDQLQRLAEIWKSKLDWDWEIADQAFRHPGDSAPIPVFGVTPAKILSFGKNPYSQTRYRFPGRSS